MLDIRVQADRALADQVVARRRRRNVMKNAPRVIGVLREGSVANTSLSNPAKGEGPCQIQSTLVI